MDGQAEKLVTTIPDAIRSIGLKGADLHKYAEERLSSFVHDLAVRWQTLQDRLRQASTDHHFGVAAAAVQAQQKNLLAQFLVDTLSRRAVIPSYSFPVHTCRLEISMSKGSSRSRKRCLQRRMDFRERWRKRCAWRGCVFCKLIPATWGRPSR